MTKEQKKAYQKAYQMANREQINAKTKAYRISHREQRKAYDKAYNISRREQRKAYIEVYRMVNREKVRAYFKAYGIANREQLREHKKAYLQTPNGKATQKKREAHRRQFGFIPLNVWFAGSHGHHIDKEKVIYIPKEIHRSIYHSVLKNINMEAINKNAMQFLQTI